MTVTEPAKTGQKGSSQTIEMAWDPITLRTNVIRGQGRKPELAEIRVGKPDVKPDATSHSWRVPQGNRGPNEKNIGHHKDGSADARRSTGISPKKHDAILAIMPNLSPG